MVTRVIHFGWDDCYRVPVLRNVGYEVREAASLETLSHDLERDREIDAVIVSEDDPRKAEQAADVVHRRSAIPVILFRRSHDELDESKFALIYSCCAPTSVWLDSMAALIEQERTVQKEAARFRRESKAVHARSRRERIQFRAEQRRNRNVAALWRPYDTSPR